MWWCSLQVLTYHMMTFHGRSLSTISTMVKDLEKMWPQDIKEVVEDVIKGRHFMQAGETSCIPSPPALPPALPPSLPSFCLCL